MLNRIFKSLAPFAALAFASATSGCDGIDISIGDGDAVPLAELDMSGEPPTELVLAGPDRVIVTEGDTLDITAEGDEDAVAALRFSRSDDALAISRKKNSGANGNATVRVTMPLPSSVVLAGSGQIDLPGMRGDADVTIAGSGKVTAPRITAEKLDVTIAGSGTLEGAGQAKSLDVTVAGSGNASLRGLRVDAADVSVAGSGDTAFASDGTVDASIMGSGDVTVIGRAKCEVSSMGSGRLVCEQGSTATRAPGSQRRTASSAQDAADAAAAPTAPETPEAPATPTAGRSSSNIAEAELRAAQAEARAARAEADAARAEADALRAAAQE